MLADSLRAAKRPVRFTSRFEPCRLHSGMLSDESRQQLCIRGALPLESREHPSAIFSRSVLTQFELAFDLLDGHFKGNNGASQFVEDIGRKAFRAPRAAARVFVLCNQVDERSLDEVAIFGSSGLTVDVYDSVVPRWHRG